MYMPAMVPPRLQMRTSRIQWSHQHSEKLGNWCSAKSSNRFKYLRKTGECPPKDLTQGVLEELEHDGDDGDEPPVTADEGLAPVSEGVGEDEDVELVPQVVVGVGGDLVVVDAAVAAVALLRDGLAEPRIDMFEELIYNFHITHN